MRADREPSAALSRQADLQWVAASAAVAVGAAAGLLATYRYGTTAGAIAGLLPLVGMLVLARPMLGIYCGIALLPLERQSVPLSGAGLSPSEITFALTAVAWAVGRLAGGRPPWSRSALNGPLLLLVLAIVPGLAVANDAFAVAKTLAMWSTFLILFQLVVAEATPTAVRRLFATLVLAGGVLGAMTVQEFQGTEIATATTARDRPEAAFGDPNTLAMLLALALPAGLVASVTGPSWLRPVCLLATATSFAGVALSLSRGGLLAAGAGLLFMLVWRPVRRRALAAAVVLLVLAFSGLGSVSSLSAFDTVSQRIASVAYSASGGVDPRFFIWERTPEIAADNLLVGVGAHNFVTVSPEYGLLDPYSRRAIIHGHNTALTVWAELGVVGLLAFVWLVVALSRLLARACMRTQGLDRGLGVGVAAAFVAWFVHGLVEYTLNSNVMAAMTFLLAGCAVVVARGADDQPAASR